MDEKLLKIELAKIIFRSRHLEEGSLTDENLAADEILKYLKKIDYGEVSYLQVA